MPPPLNKHFPRLIAASLLIFLSLLSLLTEGYFGGADNISHFLLSHHAFRHPGLFLDLWGRPLFTILSSPFAQFGLDGVRMMNAALATGTAWLAFLTARQLGIRHAPALLPFVIFTPLYFMMIPTAMTEILFGFLLLLGAFLFMEKRHLAAAVIWSLLPFARTEGFMLLPFLLPAFLWRKQYTAIPFLAAGTLFFSLAGGIFHRDLFWLINRFPYPVHYTHPIYREAGSLWHFAANLPSMMGIPLTILFTAGIAGMMVSLFSREEGRRNNARLLLLLAILPFLAYLALHSMLFWRAMGGSMGLERVMAAVLPAAALVALRGMDDGLQALRARGWIATLSVTGITAVVILIPFLSHRIPTPLSPEEETVRRTTAWLGKSPWKDRLLFYTDQNVPYYLGADPWARDPARCLLFGDSRYLDTLPAGSVLVWDAHFGAHESKIPLDSLLQEPRQQVIAFFRPLKPWLTFGGGWYEGCIVSLALPAGQSADSYAIFDSLSESLDLAGSDTLLYDNTFENPGDAWDGSFLSSDTVHRGRHAFRMDGRTEFSPGLNLPVRELLADRRQVRASLYLSLPRRDTTKNTLLVVSIEHRGKSYSYTSVRLNHVRSRPGRWDRVALTVPVPRIYAPDDRLKVYVWNPGRQRFFIDDFRVERAR